MKKIQSIIALSFLAALAFPNLAEAKKCPDGYDKGNQATCYKIHSTEQQYGTTKVMGELVSLRNRQVISFSVSLFQGKKLLCKAVGVLSGVDKNDEITFEAVCAKVVPKPDRMKFRVEAAI